MKIQKNLQTLIRLKAVGIFEKKYGRKDVVINIHKNKLLSILKRGKLKGMQPGQKKNKKTY